LPMPDARTHFVTAIGRVLGSSDPVTSG
jgi:hypothetical protein